MTTSLRTFVVAASAALLLSLAACTASPAPAESSSAAGGDASPIVTGACEDDGGVTVAVDDSALDGGLKEWCVTTEEAIGAADAFSIAAVRTEGTEEYGDQVVCRVNGLPADDTAIVADDGSDYFETCETMPAAFAYWSLWVKPAGGEWGYAEEGLSTLQLEPGDSAELLFTLNGEPAAPTP